MLNCVVFKRGWFKVMGKKENKERIIKILSKEMEKKGEILNLHCERVKATKEKWDKQDKTLLQVYFEFGYACALWDVVGKGLKYCLKKGKA